MNELVGRIRAEFLEMPGLRLTVLQASRLWGLEEDTCRRVIETLVGSSFLRWTGPGMVARAWD
jgi:Fic family protein